MDTVNQFAFKNDIMGLFCTQLKGAEGFIASENSIRRNSCSSDMPGSQKSRKMTANFIDFS